ncbi:MAG: hypothetical protein IJ307_05950, partial [Bacteroidales bacterium]|nr:hypothetical protein [Bacteroidales bacterium]
MLFEKPSKSRAFFLSVNKKTHLKRRAFRFGILTTHFVLFRRTFRFDDYTKTRFADWTSDKLSEFVAYEGAELDMKDVSIQKDLKMLKWFLRRAME